MGAPFKPPPTIEELAARVHQLEANAKLCEQAMSTMRLANDLLHQQFSNLIESARNEVPPTFRLELELAQNKLRIAEGELGHARKEIAGYQVEFTSQAIVVDACRLWIKDQYNAKLERAIRQFLKDEVSRRH